MKDLRSIDRFRLLILLAVVLAMALGSFWVLEVVRQGLNESMPNVPRKEPDYYVDKFRFVRMTNTGHVRYAVSGARMTHNPQDSSFDILQPIVTSLSPNQPPITMRADRARAEQDNSKVHLFDNVVLDRPASATTEHFQVKSNYVLALPDDDVVRTDKPVEILLGRSTLTGTGMYVNQATREFKIAGDVHGIYRPPAAH
jgi:lipopolysaccharide export system protein LptC